MKLYYCNTAKAGGGGGNFGDELNLWLWPRLVPGVLGKASPDWFVGIGTLLNDQLPSGGRLHVFGSGVGYGSAPLVDDRWTIHFVRGPLSARALGLNQNYALTDSALLVRLLREAAPRRRVGARPAIMPHFQSDLEAMRRIGELAGCEFIDPTEDVGVIMSKIASSRLVLAEAMHGAIVADALRVPWIPIASWQRINFAKWLDWTQSMDLNVAPKKLFYKRFNLRPGRPDSAWEGIKTTAVATFLKHVMATTVPQLSDEACQRHKLTLMERKLREIETAV